MSDLTPGTTFAPGQLVTAEILNRLVGDATINQGVIDNTHISTDFINSQVELDITTISDDDYFLVYDSSAGNHKKIKRSELATISNTQFTGGMITGEGDNKTTIDAVTGNITLQTGSIEAQGGSISVQSASLNGGDLILDTGGVYINGTGDGEGILDVKGALYVNDVFGNISLTGSLSASANIHTAGNITSTGSISAGTALSGASLSLTGSLTGVTGIFTGDVITTGNLGGENATLTGALGVLGNITNEGNLSTTGSITADSGNLATLAVSSTSSFTGKLTASELQATGNATLKGAIFGDNQIDFSKHLIMKAETSAGTSDGYNVYTDEIQTNYINDRNSGEVICQSPFKVDGGLLTAEKGLGVNGSFWSYKIGEDATALGSAVLREPEFTFHFLGGNSLRYQEFFEQYNYTEGLSNKVITEVNVGSDTATPVFYSYATGPKENDFYNRLTGIRDVRRKGSTIDWWGITADDDAGDPAQVWRKEETSDIGTTTTTEYTTGKLIRKYDFAWMDGDYMGADVLYDFGTTATPFHMRCLGNFSTTGTKNFKIPHPGEPGMELRHCAIEGPQADLMYRGQVQLSQGQASVNINDATSMCADTFINLVRDVQVFVQNNDTWDQVRGSVDGNILTIECQNNESTANIEWMVVAERNDPDYRKTLTNNKYETCVAKLSEPTFSTPD